MKKAIIAFSLALMLPGLALAGGGSVHVEKQAWGFHGIPKGWDKDKILRGATVATQVCMSCHSFKYTAPRSFSDAGFTEEEIRVLAEQLDVGVNDNLMSILDDNSAKEIYGKVVPDLSVMNRARPQGADYVYALLTGYTENRPADLSDIVNYNPVFVQGNGNIAMPAPLIEGMVQYHDGTKATVEQMAHDVTYFMQWTSEPELMERKQLGLYVLMYLAIFAVLTYLVKRRTWARLKRKKS